MDDSVCEMETNGNECEEEIHSDLGGIQSTISMNITDKGGANCLQTFIPSYSERLMAVAPSQLLPEQHRAYNIINWHLRENLVGKQAPQLLMVIPGEGGVEKSKTIQTITENFTSQGMKHRLVKGAYTGIATSIIDGKTLHVSGGIRVNGRKPGAQALKKLAKFWKGKDYLIIDEELMVGRKFFVQLSKAICCAKSLNSEGDVDKPFGGPNVILVGDFHQFPPVVSKRSAPLYYPRNPSLDSAEEMMGRSIYEQFTVVVRLKQQVRITDHNWADLLQHA